jgi:hypothetical protein
MFLFAAVAVVVLFVAGTCFAEAMAEREAKRRRL